MRRAARPGGAPIAVAIALAACSAPAGDGVRDTTRESTPAGGAPVTVMLGDSVPFENDLTSGTLRRVIVRTPAGPDTIRGVLAAELPVVVDDSIVVGIRREADLVKGAFEYTWRTHTLRAIALPTDAVANATPSFAPDGRHLAYLAHDSTGHGRGVVLTWPSMAVLYGGAPVTMLATDAGVDALAWTDARHFTLAIVLETPFRATQRARGTIGADDRASVVVDTVPPTAPRAEARTAP